MSRPSIDHGLLSPNGRMSKRARDAAMKREAARLFPPGFWDDVNKPPRQPTLAEQAAKLREYATMAGRAQAKKLIAKAEEIERRIAADVKPTE